MEKPDNSKEEEEKQANLNKHSPLLVEYCPSFYPLLLWHNIVFNRMRPSF